MKERSVAKKKAVLVAVMVLVAVLVVMVFVYALGRRRPAISARPSDTPRTGSVR